MLGLLGIAAAAATVFLTNSWAFLKGAQSSPSPPQFLSYYQLDPEPVRINLGTAGDFGNMRQTIVDPISGRIYVADLSEDRRIGLYDPRNGEFRVLLDDLEGKTVRTMSVGPEGNLYLIWYIWLPPADASGEATPVEQLIEVSPSGDFRIINASLPFGTEALHYSAQRNVWVNVGRFSNGDGKGSFLVRLLDLKGDIQGRLIESSSQDPVAKSLCETQPQFSVLDENYLYIAVCESYQVWRTDLTNGQVTKDFLKAPPSLYQPPKSQLQGKPLTGKEDAGAIQTWLQTYTHAQNVSIVGNLLIHQFFRPATLSTDKKKTFFYAAYDKKTGARVLDSALSEASLLAASQRSSKLYMVERTKDGEKNSFKIVASAITTTLHATSAVRFHDVTLATAEFARGWDELSLDELEWRNAGRFLDQNIWAADEGSSSGRTVRQLFLSSGSQPVVLLLFGTECAEDLVERVHAARLLPKQPRLVGIYYDARTSNEKQESIDACQRYVRGNLRKLNASETLDFEMYCLEPSSNSKLALESLGAPEKRSFILRTGNGSAELGALPSP